MLTLQNIQLNDLNAQPNVAYYINLSTETRFGATSFYNDNSTNSEKVHIIRQSVSLLAMISHRLVNEKRKVAYQ